MITQDEIEGIKHPEPEFNFSIPFTTVQGWNARLVGSIKSLDYPLIVAYMEPGQAGEDVARYSLRGDIHPGYLMPGQRPETMTLRNVDTEDMNIGCQFFAGPNKMEHADRVELGLVELTSIPPDSNPFHHDLYHMGTSVSKRWMAMYGNDHDLPLSYMILVNTGTGQRFRLIITKRHS